VVFRIQPAVHSGVALSLGDFYKLALEFLCFCACSPVRGKIREKNIEEFWV
jgi:hypothetical protein